VRSTTEIKNASALCTFGVGIGKEGVKKHDEQGYETKG